MIPFLGEKFISEFVTTETNLTELRVCSCQERGLKRPRNLAGCLKKLITSATPILDDVLATQYVPWSLLSIELSYHITLSDKTKIIDRVLRNFIQMWKKVYLYIGPIGNKIFTTLVKIRANTIADFLIQPTYWLKELW